jgi:hypothetical protein
MNLKSKFSRRNLLRGVGATVALPLLESHGKPSSLGSSTTPPKRLVFLNFGYGPSEAWYPTEAGANFALPEAMQPLAKLRDSFSVISNLTNVKASGVGAHWGATTWLTGADVRRTPGREFHNAISCDQVAATHLGKDVRFESLALSGTEQDVTGAGPGTSLSWDELGNPVQGISDQVALFSQLFGDGGMTLAERRHHLIRQRSVLDAVRADAKGVSGIVSARDREKVDEYFELIRNIEKRLGREGAWLDRPKPEAPMAEPASSLKGTERVGLMFDLMLAALRTDSTRVITYRMPTNSLFEEFEAETGTRRVGAHPMTHSAKGSDGHKQLLWRDKKICSLFATLLEKMKGIEEADGSRLLDNTLVVMGSGLHTGHKRQNLPILLGGGKSVIHGQNYVYTANESRLANLWLAMLKWAGCPVGSFADSDGPLTEMFS